MRRRRGDMSNFHKNSLDPLGLHFPYPIVFVNLEKSRGKLKFLVDVWCIITVFLYLFVNSGPRFQVSPEETTTPTCKQHGCTHKKNECVFTATTRDRMEEAEEKRPTLFKKKKVREKEVYALNIINIFFFQANIKSSWPKKESMNPSRWYKRVDAILYPRRRSVLIACPRVHLLCCLSHLHKGGSSLANDSI